MQSGDLFLKSIAAWKAKVKAGLEGLGRVAIQDLAEQVIDNTHIDTGFLVGSWQPSLEAPLLETVDSAKGTKGAAAGIATSALAISIVDLKMGDVFYYTNVVLYAKYQEWGTSIMEGRFMVTRAVANWDRIVEGAAMKLGLAA